MSREFWRVGRSVGRTIYDAHDDLIGVMDTPALAERVVSAVNAVSVDVAALCHWQQNRDGVQERETHSEFHFGYPCPYEAVAAILRGDPDPREEGIMP